MSRFNPKNAHRKGFTMVELVIVIAVVAILAAVTIPAVMYVRNNAIRAELKQNINDSYSKFANAQIADGQRAASIDNYLFVEAEAVVTSGSVATGLKNPTKVHTWDGKSDDVHTEDFTTLEVGDFLYAEKYGQFYIVRRIAR